MPPELRYLAIEWAEPGRPSRLDVAPEPIAVQREDDGSWRAETEIFHDNLPWIGLRAGDADEPTPAIVLPSGKREEMLRIEVPGHDAFWIECGRWDAVGHRHLSALHRESGRVNIEMGRTGIVLDHTMGGAGRLDDYLADFRNEFIWLMLGANAKAQGRVAAGGSLNLDLAAALTAFATAARAIVERPATQIREIVAPSPVARVRPIAATFRQYARNPAALALPGRLAVESLDTPENRYLRHMIAAALRLARTASTAFARSVVRFSEAATSEAVRAEALAATKWRTVDPEVLDNQFAERVRLAEDILGYTNGECMAP